MAAATGRQTGGPIRIRSSLATAFRQTRVGMFPLLTTALIIQGITALVVIPAISAIFKLALQSAGVAGITDRNLGRVLAQPAAFGLLFALVVIALVAVSVQLITIIVIAHHQQSGQPLGIRPVVSDLARAIRAVLHYQSPLLMVYVFLIMPIGGFGLFSTITRGIAVPLFISGEMMKTAVSALLYCAAIAVVVYLNIRLIFTFPLLVIEGKSLARAVAASVTATRKQSWRIAAVVGLVGIVAAVATTTLAELVLFTVSLTDRLSPVASGIAASMGYGVATVGSAVILSLALVVIVQTLTAAYRSRMGHPATETARENDAPQRTGRRLGAATVALGLTGALVLTSASAIPPVPETALDIEGTAVIAHRGFVGGGVENTIGALEAAAAMRPDFVEIDAQETKDGRFILSHDINLWLVSGKNVNTYELTLDQAVRTTVSVGGFSDKMSSLTGYVKRAEELGVTLMIELKMHGRESPDVVDRFLAEMDSMGSTDKHVYHSLDVAAVNELKVKRPELTVGRTMAASIGNVSDVPCDFLLVEQSFYSEAFVKYARKQNISLLVWTVNDEEEIRDYLRKGVDGIVTDRPEVLIQERESISGESGASPRLRDALDQFTLL